MWKELTADVRMVAHRWARHFDECSLALTRWMIDSYLNGFGFWS